MKYLYILVSILCAFPLRVCAQQPEIVGTHAAGDPFFLVQISDPQLGFRENGGIGEGERLLREAVRAINAIRPSFVVVTGDMVNNPGDETQFEAYRRLIDSIRPDIPVFHVPGNHDIGKFTEAGRQNYLARYGYDRFFFQFGDCAFIGIDSCPIRDGVSQAEEAQYAWLCARLEETQECRERILFLHCPIILTERHEPESYSNFPESMRQRYISLLKRYAVRYVFAGHLHNTSYAEIDGIRMFTCGPSGKPLGTGYSGMNLITVSADSVHVDYVTAAEARRPELFELGMKE